MEAGANARLLLVPVPGRFYQFQGWLESHCAHPTYNNGGLSVSVSVVPGSARLHEHSNTWLSVFSQIK